MEFSEQNPTSRQTCLSVMLAGMLVAFLLFVVILLTGGAVLYVLPVMLGLGLFGWMHYLWWGRGLDRETAGEREEFQLQQETTERDGWPFPDSDQHQWN